MGIWVPRGFKIGQYQKDVNLEDLKSRNSPNASHRADLDGVSSNGSWYRRSERCFRWASETQTPSRHSCGCEENQRTISFNDIHVTSKRASSVGFLERNEGVEGGAHIRFSPSALFSLLLRLFSRGIAAKELERSLPMDQNGRPLKISLDARKRMRRGQLMCDPLLHRATPTDLTFDERIRRFQSTTTVQQQYIGKLNRCVD